MNTACIRTKMYTPKSRASYKASPPLQKVRGNVAAAATATAATTTTTTTTTTTNYE